MYDVCDGPDLGRCEEGYAENEAVKYGDGREVAEPHPSIVEPVLISIRSRSDGNRRHSSEMIKVQVPEKPPPVLRAPP